MPFSKQKGGTLQQKLNPVQKGLKTIHDFLSGSARKKNSQVGTLTTHHTSDEDHTGTTTLLAPNQWMVDMDIFLHNQPDPKYTTPRRGCVDTGSDISWVKQSIIDELGAQKYEHISTFQPMGPPDNAIKDKGCVALLWRIEGKPEEGKPDEEYTTKFHICPEDWVVNFDFLLGQDWLRESKMYVRRSGAARYIRRRK